MKNLRNKGITLIALVVTIIILLILAGVTIGMATSGAGLFDKAKEAAQKYQNAQEDEEMQIAKYNNEISSYLSGNRNVTSSDILWQGTSTSGCEIQLSKPLSDYAFIEIYFTNGDTDHACPIQKFDTAKIIEKGQLYIYDSREYYGYNARYTYDSTSNKLTNVSNKNYGHSDAEGFILTVYKIVGIN